MESTYTSQPVLLKVWKIKHRFLPFALESHETSSSANSLIRFSTLFPKSNQSTSLTGTTKVIASIPLEVYISANLLKCFGMAPNHPKITAATSQLPAIGNPESGEEALCQLKSWPLLGLERRWLRLLKWWESEDEGERKNPNWEELRKGERLLSEI